MLTTSLSTVDTNSDLLVYYPLPQDANQDSSRHCDKHICIKVSLDAIYGNTPEESDINLIRAICQPLSHKILELRNFGRPSGNGYHFAMRAAYSVDDNAVIPQHCNYRVSLNLFLQLIKFSHVVFRGSFIKERFTEKLSAEIKITPEGESLPSPVIREEICIDDELSISIFANQRQATFPYYAPTERDSKTIDKMVMQDIVFAISSMINNHPEVRMMAEIFYRIIASDRSENVFEKYNNQFQNICSKFIDQGQGYLIHVTVRGDSALKNLPLFARPGATLTIHELHQEEQALTQQTPSPQQTPLQFNSMFSHTISEATTEETDLYETTRSVSV